MDSETPSTNGRLLWGFLQQLLSDANQSYTTYIQWKNKDAGVFKIVNPEGLAKLWGIQKNHLSMNYDKMTRALRYYYGVNILRKVKGERHCYQFLRNPSELKSIKNISLLRQQMEAQAAQQQLQLAVVAHQSPVRGDVSVSPHPAQPTDFTTTHGREREERESERYYSQLMERYNIDRSSTSRDQSEERDGPRNQFDYLHLIPEVSIKTE